MPQLSMLLKSDIDVTLGSSPSSLLHISSINKHHHWCLQNMCPGVLFFSSLLQPHLSISLSTQLIFPNFCHLSHLFSSLWPEWPFLNLILPHSILPHRYCMLPLEVLGGPIWPDLFPLPPSSHATSLPASMLQQHQPPFKFFSHLVLFQIRATHLFFPLPKMASFPQPSFCPFLYKTLSKRSLCNDGIV